MSFPASKAEALSLIKTYALQYRISIEEIAALLTAADAPEPAKKRSGQIMSTILSYLGGLLVFAGIGIYTGIVWDSLSPALRVFITLAPGVVALILGILCLKDEKYQRASTPLLLIAALLQPTGLLVYMKEYMEPSGNIELALAAVFSLIGLQQALLFRKFNRTTFLFFAVMFSFAGATALLNWLDADYELAGFGMSFAGLCLTSWIGRGEHRILAPWFLVIFGGGLVSSLFAITANPDSSTFFILLSLSVFAAVLVGIIKTAQMPRHNILAFGFFAFLSAAGTALDNLGADPALTALICGASGVAAGYALSNTMHGKAAHYLYIIFGITLSWGVYDLTKDTGFDIAMIGFGAAAMYLSVVIASRVLLTVSVLSLLGYLAYFTDTYFADVVGWPIAMIVFGLALIMISSYAMKLGRTIPDKTIQGQ